MEAIDRRPREVRRQKFNEQVVRPITRGEVVFDAFARVDRWDFIPRGNKRVAYEDRIIQLGNGSSISQPSLVVQMIELLEPYGSGNVLEVGTGSGYNAAVLSHCFERVDTIEADQSLVRSASRRLSKLGYSNLYVHSGDGALGLPDYSPYDRIIVTAGAQEIPISLAQQLKDGGRMVIPVGNDPSFQKLNVIVKSGSNLDRYLVKNPERVHFHWLMSSAQGGWTEESLQRVVDFKISILHSFAEMFGLEASELVALLGQKLNTTPQGVIREMSLPEKISAEGLKAFFG